MLNVWIEWISYRVRIAKESHLKIFEAWNSIVLFLEIFRCGFGFVECINSLIDSESSLGNGF